jgi:hypothetical protein
MAARLWNPHIGTLKGGLHHSVAYIIQMRVPRDEGYGSPMVALSDYTTSRRTADSWLADARVKAGRYLRDTRNK